MSLDILVLVIQIFDEVKKILAAILKNGRQGRHIDQIFWKAGFSYKAIYIDDLYQFSCLHTKRKSSGEILSLGTLAGLSCEYSFFRAEYLYSYNGKYHY